MRKRICAGLFIVLAISVGCRSTSNRSKQVQNQVSPSPTLPIKTDTVAIVADVITASASTIVADAASVGSDTSSIGSDTSSVGSDAGSIGSDAGSIRHDTSRKQTIVADAASVGSDASSVGSDAGSIRHDTSREQTIDLTTALLMTTGQSPQVAFARARIEEALAQVDRANALKLPSLRAGVNYNKHEGRIQDVAGNVIETSRGSFYSGFGANAVGAGSPAVPGLVSQFHFADAVFQPRIAQRTACARQAGAHATTNDQLLATAIAYTELIRAEQELAAANEIVTRAEQLAKATFEFEKAGEGLASDYDRARTELSLRKNEKVRAEELSDVASARLAEIIHWDSDKRLMPSEPQLVPIELVTSRGSQQELVALALSNRPELSESRHLVGEAVERLKRERNAPLVPSVLLAASYGGLGGGLGGNLTNYGDRFDADAVAFWELRQLGLGEQAAQRDARSKIKQAKMRELATMDRVAREVNESYSQIKARRRQIVITQEAVIAANDSFDRNWNRIRNGQGLPIEALQSIQALATARREYIRAVSEFNVAQFTLQRSLGWPIREPANSQTNQP